MKVEIHTERTVIRPYEGGDVLRVAPLLAGAPDGKGGVAVAKMEDVGAWIARAREEHLRFGTGRMAVELGNGLLIGDCGITRERLNGSGEVDVLGVIIAPEYRRKGYGMECARAMLLYGMMKKGLRRVVTVVPEGDRGAERIARGIGMVPDGDVRSAGEGRVYVISLAEIDAERG